MPATSICRICSGTVVAFVDFGPQPMANDFVPPGRRGEVFSLRLAVGMCRDCTTVQLLDDAPHDSMFHSGYLYRSSGSVVMRKHFEELAGRLLTTELDGEDPFVVELGCNDGIMLRTLADAGIRHLGVEPCGDVAEVSRAGGLNVVSEFFEEGLAARIRAEEGPADVIFAANTLSHISFIDSVFRGVDSLLAPDGVLVFEDPYFADIAALTSFDQIYHEHVFFFTARSVQRMAVAHGMELVAVERLPVHGGEIRCTLARPGARPVSPSVAELLAEEEARALTAPETLARFAEGVEHVCTELVALLRGLREQGKRVVGYGATAKSSTLLNHCGIGPDLLDFVCDSTPAKQGTLTPGRHIPVRGPEAFADPYPDYALLLAWNHADEIMKKEEAFSRSGGRWIHYVPEVRIG